MSSIPGLYTEWLLQRDPWLGGLLDPNGYTPPNICFVGDGGNNGGKIDFEDNLRWLHRRPAFTGSRTLQRIQFAPAYSSPGAEAASQGIFQPDTMIRHRDKCDQTKDLRAYSDQI